MRAKSIEHDPCDQSKAPDSPRSTNTPADHNCQPLTFIYSYSRHRILVLPPLSIPSILQLRGIGFMFAQLFQYLFGRWKKPVAGLTEDDLTRFDIAFDEPLTMFDNERVLVEEGEVVGDTAVFNDQGVIVPTTCKLPSGVEQTFEKDTPELRYAAKCTTFVIVDTPTMTSGSWHRYFGTAFFVSPKILLTAGHNTLGPQGPLKNVRITTPGLVHMSYNLLQTQKLATIDCKVVGSLYTGKHSDSYLTDIAILHSGSYTAGDYLPLSSDPSNPGSKVNVIGYPSPAKEEWLAIHEGLQNVEASRLVTDQMFPPRRLTITSGTVEAVEGNISYRVSTMPGMSGAPVICNGSAIGVHVGQPIEKVSGVQIIKKDVWPMAVSFTNEDVVNFLIKHKCWPAA